MTTRLTSPLSACAGCFLLLCFLWSPLLVKLPVSAMPAAEAKDRMRASMGYPTEVPTPDTATASTTEEGEYFVQPTRKPYNCSLSHRPHGNDSNKFQVRHNNAWWDQVCQTGLVWNQTLCRCDYEGDPADFPFTAECRDYRPHERASGKYQQKVNGAWVTRDCNLAVAGLIWNQTSCRCVWGPEGDGSSLDFERSTPCETMLNVTFEKGLVDEARSSFLELTSGSVLALRQYDADPDDGEANTAAYFQSAVMTVWYFAGNEMSGSLRVEFRFKAEDSPLTRDTYQILLSNGCNVTGLGFTTPTIAVGYRAADRSFLLALHTANTRKAIVCTRDGEAYAWHHVSLIYEDGMLLLRVDDRPCIISTDFSGEVQKSACPLTIGADPLDKESRYIGYLDDLVVARHCRRFVDQILVADGDDDAAAQYDDDDDDDDVGDETTPDDENGDNNNAPAQSGPLEGPSSAHSKSPLSGPDAKSARRGDKTVQHGDKTAQRGDKTAQRGDKTAQRGDKTAQRGDKTAQRGEKTAQRGDKTAQRGDKTAQRGDKTAQRGDKTAQRGDKTAQRGDKTAQRGDKTAQRGDKTAQRGDKSRGDDKAVQRGAKSAERGDAFDSSGPREVGDGGGRNGRREGQTSGRTVDIKSAPSWFRLEDPRDNKIQPFRAMQALA
ncbi:uncharacterized protein LOC143299647 [Babylonia areolata]|uniref:uncharacterized protein LOC143299647 n=1 Tax=Babylonia areolata TaxID=304850 RepID=UPI003FD2B451